MCPTSIDGYPEVEESTVDLLQMPQNVLQIVLYKYNFIF
jgi:hypothetical protein